MIRVLIFSKGKLTQERIQAILSGARDIQMMGIVENPEEVLLSVQSLHPEIILVDCSLLVDDWLEMTRQILSSETPVKMIAVSFFTTSSLNSLEANGIKGFVDKADLLELDGAIHAVYQGHPYYSNSVKAELADLTESNRS